LQFVFLKGSQMLVEAKQAQLSIKGSQGLVEVLQAQLVPPTTSQG